MLGPFQVLKRPLTLTPADAKPKAAGSERAGPVAWWKFDETAGATAANAAGNNHSGQVQGQPRWASGQGKQGGALEFDGVRNWVECDDPAGLDLRDALSISAWFKVRQFDQASQTLLAKGEAWRLQRQGEKGALEFAILGPKTTKAPKGGSPNITTKRTVDDGAWHHVAGVYDGQRAVLYLDGTEEGSVAATGTVTPNNVPVALGENALSRGRFFNGWMDDVRLYNRGLSAEEVQSLYRGDGK